MESATNLVHVLYEHARSMREDGDQRASMGLVKIIHIDDNRSKDPAMGQMGVILDSEAF